MEVVFGSKEHGEAIGVVVGTLYHPEEHYCISTVDNDGKLLGGIVYTDYHVVSIQMHIAGFRPRWLSRDFLWVIFDYPFTQLGCKKVFGPISSKNARSLAFASKIGFKYVATIPGVLEDADLVLLDMDRDDCRWLKLQPSTLRRAF